MLRSMNQTRLPPPIYHGSPPPPSIPFSPNKHKHEISNVQIVSCYPSFILTRSPFAPPFLTSSPFHPFPTPSHLPAPIPISTRSPPALHHPALPPGALFTSSFFVLLLVHVICQIVSTVPRALPHTVYYTMFHFPRIKPIYTSSRQTYLHIVAAGLVGHHSVHLVDLRRKRTEANLVVQMEEREKESHTLY